VQENADGEENDLAWLIFKAYSNSFEDRVGSETDKKDEWGHLLSASFGTSGFNQVLLMFNNASSSDVNIVGA